MNAQRRRPPTRSGQRVPLRIRTLTTALARTTVVPALIPDLALVPCRPHAIQRSAVGQADILRATRWENDPGAQANRHPRKLPVTPHRDMNLSASFPVFCRFLVLIASVYWMGPLRIIARPYNEYGEADV